MLLLLLLLLLAAVVDDVAVDVDVAVAVVVVVCGGGGAAGTCLHGVHLRVSQNLSQLRQVEALYSTQRVYENPHLQLGQA